MDFWFHIRRCLKAHWLHFPWTWCSLHSVLLSSSVFPLLFLLRCYFWQPIILACFCRNCWFCILCWSVAAISSYLAWCSHFGFSLLGFLEFVLVPFSAWRSWWIPCDWLVLVAASSPAASVTLGSDGSIHPLRNHCTAHTIVSTVSSKHSCLLQTAWRSELS